MLKDFKEFAVKGNMVDMGVGIVIGAAFTSIINSFVKDIITPFLSLFTSGVDYTNWFYLLKSGEEGGPYKTIADAIADKAITVNIGTFINSIISFILVAFVLFMVVRYINNMKKMAVKEEEEEKSKNKDCPSCLSSIPKEANKCAFCTSDVS